MKKLLILATITAALMSPAMAHPYRHYQHISNPIHELSNAMGNIGRSITSGIASVYGLGERLNPLTKSGESFNSGSLTVASPTLPMGTRVRITNHKTGKSVIARVNDRGPARWTGRVIDLTPRVARSIGVHGLGHVSIQRLASR